MDPRNYSSSQSGGGVYTPQQTQCGTQEVIYTTQQPNCNSSWPSSGQRIVNVSQSRYGLYNNRTPCQSGYTSSTSEPSCSSIPCTII